MLDESLLRDRFEQILDHQREMEGVYASMADGADCPMAREQIEQIRRDKRRHVMLVERVFEILG